ncbi:hypothetical protein EVJ50_12675 [Synechococcus sp. RSCCF101]|uniref:hypothetical protein n=1 Tax=Synechococcus sp. RSCCF101 TaxID=2511069 RepID=UPI001246BE0F|nr:hypothetical protein [Synechococcus sp. RSCCF101]QEY32952.1 hypothetical protein EVJ50_12675 [Synechococcus sp. RSCCF101]
MPRASRSPSRRPGPRSAAVHRGESSDVQVSAVISTYLLTHLHHVLQRAEYGAAKDGRTSLAANYAQLRKVLCMEARSLEGPAATGAGDHDPPCAA